MTDNSNSDLGGSATKGMTIDGVANVAASPPTTMVANPANGLPSLPTNAGEIAKLRAQISIEDRAGISVYGDKAQRAVVDYADKVLASAKNKEMGETGKLLLEVIAKAKGIDPAALREKGFFSRIFGGARAQMEKFKGQFEDVASQVETISFQLDKRKEVLKKDISMLDSLHEQTRNSIVQLDQYIEAGKSFAENYRQHELPALKAQADAAQSTTPDGLMAAQAYQDAVQALDRLEKRVYYLQQARQIGIQQLPQIRIVQSGDETLIENLQATTRLTIPVWKQKMVLLLGLARQEEALQLQKAVTDATNEMMKQASAMMKDQAVEIEKQSQRGIVDMETLEQTNRDLIDAINSVLQIQQEGRSKRAEAERRMEEMTAELKSSLSQAPFAN